jgi:hypothetical protein
MDKIIAFITYESPWFPSGDIAALALTMRFFALTRAQQQTWTEKQ